jgi:glycosyltransferase involved in cell wall biosynthesis
MTRAGYAQLPLAGRFDLLMSNSQASAASLAEGLADRARSAGIIVCPPVIGVRSQPPATAAGGQLLFVGRLAPHKGVHHLLQAFAALPEGEPEPALAIVGTPSSLAYRDALFRLHEALPAHRRERVVFHQDLAPEALDALYRRAALFITLSAHEGFCLPILEALQHGLPVLALDGPAIAALLAEGRLASAGPREVAAAIAALLAAPVRRRRLAARQRARLPVLAEAADGRRVWEALQRILALDARPV